jgi:hypothetical protein
VLLDELDERVRAETSRCYLEHDDQHGWQVTGTNVAGRVHHSEDHAPDVIIDGRRLSWAQFGQMVATFDDWWFRLGFGDNDVPTPQPGGSQPA